MIRNCRYTGQGFDSPRLHHLWGRTWKSTGMTMVESRLHGEATSQKLQNSNWKLQSITHGCLVSKPEFGQYLSTETAHLVTSQEL